MQPEEVVEHLDELEDRVKGLRTGWPCDQVNELGFQRCEETLGDGVVPALARSGQRRAYAVGLGQLDELARRVLRAAVGVQYQPGSGPAVMDGHA